MVKVGKSLGVALFIGLFLLLTSYGIYADYTQKTTTLNISAPSFVFEETHFNDSSSSKEYNFNQSGNVTYWVQMARNSTVTFSGMTLRGGIIYVYNTSTATTGIIGMSINDVVGGGGNEIIMGTLDTDGKIRVLYGANGSLIWSYDLPSGEAVMTTTVGNVTNNAGNEIAAGSNNNSIFLLDATDTSASVLWSRDMGGNVLACAIADVNGDGSNEVVGGSGEGSGRVVVFNSVGTELWRYVLDANDLAIADINESTGNETIVASGTSIYVLNSSGNLSWSLDLGNTINAISVNNVTTATGVGIAAGLNNGTVYMLNVTSRRAIWSYNLDSAVRDVVIGDSTTEYSGNEVVAGSNGGYIYTLNSSGSLIWNFYTGNFVRTVAVGDLTSDSGNEVVAGDDPSGAAYGSAYAFNFDYFPTNISIDIGADGTRDWNSSYGKLRSSETVTGLESAITSALASSCQSEVCNMSFVFISSGPGKLNISGLNVTYAYNVTDVFTYTQVSSWSRTSGVSANESVGNYTMSITYARNPAYDVSVAYVYVNSSASVCDFNGSRKTVSTIAGQKACNIDDFTLPASGALPAATLLWDNTMETGVPVLMNESAPWNTSTSNNYYWRKNLTIWNNTGVTFLLVEANTTLYNVKGSAYLNVTWKGAVCNITPDSTDAGCNTAGPSYTSRNCSGDTFYVCMKDTDSNGAADFFRWKQPYVNSTMSYQAGGMRNLPAVLNGNSVTPASSAWGGGFNFSIDVNDSDSDTVNVTMWLFTNTSGLWRSVGTQNASGSRNLVFNATSNGNWSGNCGYLFEYVDWNASGQIRNAANTSYFTGPLVEKHNTSAIYVMGNATSTIRAGSNYSLLIVKINDTTTGVMAGEGVNCTFRVTTSGSTYDGGHSNTTNSSGFCHYYFDPDSNYSIGNHVWKAGVYQDIYYADSESETFNVSTEGSINITFSSPSAENATMYRNSTNFIEARLSDLYESSVNVSGYNCTFWFNGVQIASSLTGTNGRCNYTWNVSCSIPRGNLQINVTLVGNASSEYGIYSNESHLMVNMVDNLTAAVTSPANYSYYSRGQNITLTASVNDTCLLCNPANYTLAWRAEHKNRAVVNISETTGLNRTGHVVRINATYLKSLGIEAGEWAVNATSVFCGGAETPSEVLAWSNSSRAAINGSVLYMDDNSELLFTASLAGGTSRTCAIYYNRTNPAGHNISLIENGGFEAGNETPWALSSSACSAGWGCNKTVIHTGSPGNYSLYISSGDAGGTSRTVAMQTLKKPLKSYYLKIRYKAWGEYSSGNATISAGNGMCGLNISGDIPVGSGVWEDALCYNESFMNAGALYINVSDQDGGGGVEDACHLYVDYICAANATGSCVSSDDGLPLSYNVIHDEPLGTGSASWSLAANESLGLRKITGNATGAYYRPASSTVFAYVYGWSNVSLMNITSNYCVYSEPVKCMTNASMTLYCRVYDMNTSLPIEGHNVSFYNDGAYLGSNYTVVNGMAYWSWPFSTDVTGLHQLVCNLTNDDRVFYYAVNGNGKVVQINITAGNTTGSVLFNPYVRNASAITRASSYSFSLDVTLNNTGTSNMYNTAIQIVAPAGIIATPVSCGSIGALGYCTQASAITVNTTAALGSNSINFTALWYNDDYTQGNATNQSFVFVLNSTVLNVAEAGINYSIPVGGRKRAGNFTADAYGNTNMAGVNYTISGTDASEIRSWISFEPDGMDISRGGTQVVYLNLTVPRNATMKSYLANLTVNATGSPCSPAGNCWDTLALNFTVSVQDWSLTPSYMNKTIGTSEVNGVIGVVTVSNNQDVNYSLNLTVIGNGSAYIKTGASVLNVSGMSSSQVDIYHNSTSGFNISTWYANVSFINNDRDAVPSVINATVELKVINLYVKILSPNSTNQAGPVNSSHMVNATLNITLDGSPEKDGVNETSNIEINMYVGGQLCAGPSYGYNATTKTWRVSCYAPAVPGNPISNTLRAVVSYNVQNMYLQSDNSDAVLYDDITPPQIIAIRVNNSDSEGNVNQTENVSTIIIITNITDNTAVSAAWASVTYPNSSSYSFRMHSLGGNAWSFNFSNPQLIGDYKVDVYANDTAHSMINNTVNSSIGYFDVFLPMRFLGTANSANGTAESITFKFYKTGTNWKIHEFSTNSTGGYNAQVHQRSYDIVADVFGHTVRFVSANMTLSAQDQSNTTSALSNPFRFDSIPNNSVGEIGNVHVPDGVKSTILAFTVETLNMSYVSKQIEIYYGSAWFTGLVEGRIRLMTCGSSSWQFQNRTCSATPGFYSTSQGPDESSNIFSFSTGTNTTYILVECTKDDCSPPATTTVVPSMPDIPSAPSIPPYPPTQAPVTCGNDICEVGENNQNCPADCGAAETPFSLRTSLGEDRIFIGTNKTYVLWVTNNIKRSLNVALSVEGSLKEFITIENPLLSMASNGTEATKLYVYSTADTAPGTYSGSIIATDGEHSEVMPLNLVFARAGDLALDLTARIKNAVITIYDQLEVEVNLFNLGTVNEVNGTITYEIKNMRTGSSALKETEHVSVKTRKTFLKLINLREAKITPGKYVLEVSVAYGDQKNEVSDSFDLVQPIFTPENTLFILLACAATAGLVIGLYGWRKYRLWKTGKARYIFPLDFGKLPKEDDDNFWVGKIAETEKKAWINPNDLTTHALVAGATGSGKSVSASVITEEALKKGIPVVVFDPTAQWTGFVRPCKDENLLRCYPLFGMKREDARPFKGLIYEVTDPNIKIDFKKYMKPGEVTVFTLNKLKPGEYDVAVQNIVDTIFAVGWEESPDLRMLVVFDEVHRLLEKYGGKGGYVALEKACREFRKWGIGLVMASQVSSDFKEAVMGNVLTEIQLNTKSMEDIKKIETKYGKNYSSRITHEGVGVGMLQNPKYNEGKPYFIQFRPTLHQPHKITDEEMEMYKKYTGVLEQFTARAAAMKAKGLETTDIEMEIELVKDKLKEGRFRMVEIYVQSLQEKLK